MAFADIIEELKDIKLVELNLERNIDTLKIIELNELQKEILKLFDMNKKRPLRVKNTLTDIAPVLPSKVIIPFSLWRRSLSMEDLWRVHEQDFRLSNRLTERAEYERLVRRFHQEEERENAKNLLYGDVHLTREDDLGVD